MKRKDFQDLKNKDIKDLRKMVFAKKAEAAKKKMEILGSKEKNLKSFRNERRDIARILTLIREKEIIEELNKKGESQGL